MRDETSSMRLVNAVAIARSDRCSHCLRLTCGPLERTKSGAADKLSKKAKRLFWKPLVLHACAACTAGTRRWHIASPGADPVNPDKATPPNQEVP